MRYLLFVLLLSLSLTSCVTKKRFRAELLERALLEIDHARLQGRYDSLATSLVQLEHNLSEVEKSKKNLAEMSEAELRSLNSQLQNKIAMLEESNRKVQELQAAIQKQKDISNQLLAKIKSALVGFTPEELTVEMRDGKVYVSLSDQLLFKSGSASVDPKGKQALSKVAEVLQRQNDIDVVIEGHTDNVPLKGSVIKDNWDLSVMRATSVVKILTEDYKVNPKQVVASGRGEYFPVADNASSEGKAKNRRTEIILSPKIGDLLKILEGK